MRGRCIELAQYGPWLHALDDTNSESRGVRARGFLGDDITEHHEDEAERTAETNNS
jgi:hypothetical protein